MPDELLNACTIEQYLDEVAHELPSGTQRSIIIVGGAFLAWYGLRDATRDVDSITRLDGELATASAPSSDTDQFRGPIPRRLMNKSMFAGRQPTNAQVRALRIALTRRYSTAS